MKIFPPEPTVELYKEGFEENDILQRKSVGKALSNLVDRIDDPMVVALDGHWGTGKTYFLKRWVGAHKLQNDGKATTVYFDAFANDYLNDPLAALVSTLTARLPGSEEDKINKIKAAAFKFAKPLAKIGLHVATFGATEALNDLGDAVVNSASNAASSALDDYWKKEDGRRAAMEEFRLALEELIAPSETEEEEEAGSTLSAGAHLVIVIDELDRCRPDYALEVLEIIKHFFSVPGVSFVLGANLIALENSVKARYGSEIDASAYLRKFINVTLTLPSEIGHFYNSRDATTVYLTHHLSKMGIPSHIADRLKPHLKIVSRNNHISIRDIGKILTAISLLSNDLLEGRDIPSGWIDITLTLVVSKILRPELFPKFLNLTISEADLEDYFDATIPRRKRTIGEATSNEYDPDTWINFNYWRYLAQDGQLPEEKEEMVVNMGKRFDRWGRPDDPHLVPKEAHHKWLDLFSAMNT